MSRLVERVKKHIIFVIQYFFQFLPIKKNKLFFFSYYGSQYGCNPKYITEYIIEHIPKDKFDIVWAFSEPTKIKDIKGIRKVKMMSISYFYEICTSKVIITNFRTTNLFRKRKGQYYIQTWHSSLRLKQIEKDAIASLPANYVEMAKKDSQKCDLLLSGCQYSTAILKRSFWYGGEIFEQGTPRNDVLLKEDPTKQVNIRSALGIPTHYKIVLYAPTFRKNEDLAIYDLNYASVLQSLRRKFGGEWMALVKLHPHLLLESSKLESHENVLNVTQYDDVQELLSIVDVLITDYSSLMFDYGITQKPCFLYVPDLEEYTRHDRSLYFDLKALPFRIAKNQEQLLKTIASFDGENYHVDLHTFFKKVGSFEEGKASEKVVERITEICFEGGKKRNEAV
ncbi:hypothetical protein J14TS2_36910 [Bacillus sp. J14TS2]|uniref:CDP-glycerol glycerophosphotransferase family protein n=1 Tax=Bacillus sp. J14TS2 TaxID=2807188 RepID=UPI001B123307|nr:CDP-glycerol glycerophosphotransferase family protein [Bacillus sp. J14TS2]GIN73216.1 hypothetical protein J14TS2_36910 [Bacillus sp. J14TS2]